MLPDPELFKKLSHRLFAGEQLSPAEIDVVRRRSRFIADFLLKRADDEAQVGARLVSFGEGAFPVLKQDEASLLQRCSALAHVRNIYIGLPLATLNVGHMPSVEDKLVLISPWNQIAWSYYKTQLFPGFEVREFVKSTGLLPVATTPVGRVGGAIAFDMDFPALLRQAGKQHSDLLIVPEDDSREIDPLHSKMAAFRAIENGFNLVLHASNGLSLSQPTIRVIFRHDGPPSNDLSRNGCSSADSRRYHAILPDWLSVSTHLLCDTRVFGCSTISPELCREDRPRHREPCIL